MCESNLINKPSDVATIFDCKGTNQQKILERKEMEYNFFGGSLLLKVRQRAAGFVRLSRDPKGGEVDLGSTKE